MQAVAGSARQAEIQHVSLSHPFSFLIRALAGSGSAKDDGATKKNMSHLFRHLRQNE